MPYTKALPEWNSGGIKPPQSKLDNGWQVDEKPPAAWWNWFMYTSYQAMQELQQNAVHNEKLGANGGVATLGNDGKLTAAQLPAIGSEQITDGTIANAELASDVKVGSLASLTTMAKASVTDAINEVKQLIDTHSNDSTRHITAQERTTWNAAQLLALTSADGTPKSVVTNLNTATTLGLYIVGSSATGAPTTAVGLLYVWRRGTTHVLQDYWEISTNEKHHRTSIDNGATWTTWQKLANTDVATTSKNGLMSSSDKTALDNTQKWKLTTDDGKAIIPPNGTNFDTILSSGTYRYSNELSHSGQPEPRNYWQVEVVNFDGTYVTQRWTALFTPIIYIRRGSALGWWNFKRITDNNILGGILLGNKLVDMQTANFVGKVSGSTTVNPHIAKYGRGSVSSLSPASSFAYEFSSGYTSIPALNGAIVSTNGSNSTEQAFHLFSFDLIAHVERTYGTIPGATTADKVAWLKANINFAKNVYAIRLFHYGFGSSPQGNKLNLAYWNAEASAWQGVVSHTSGVVTKLERHLGNFGYSFIDANGFVHFLVYADPSDGVTSSVINTDYVELQVEISTSIWDNVPKTWTNLTLQNGAQEYATGTAPRYRKEGNMVTVQGAVKFPTSISAATGIGTLPDGFRPNMPISISLPTTIRSGFSSVRSTRWVVGTNGVISLEGVQDGYQANEWLPVTLSFVVG